MGGKVYTLPSAGYLKVAMLWLTASCPNRERKVPFSVWTRHSQPRLRALIGHVYALAQEMYHVPMP